jgi:hypothetical protein
VHIGNEGSFGDSVGTGFDSVGVSIIRSDSILDSQNIVLNGKAFLSSVWTIDTFPALVSDAMAGAIDHS